MIPAFFYRYTRVLWRSPWDTLAMFARPLLSGVLLMVFAGTVSGGNLSRFMVVSVFVSNIVMNTILGAAYEARMDLDESKREVVELAPGGLRRYAFVQAVTQFVIAFSQSLLVLCVLLPATGGGFTPTLGFVCGMVVLIVGVIACGARAALRSAQGGSFVNTSFTIGIVLTFSGVFYPVDLLPQWARIISSLNPATYVIASIRGAFVEFEAINPYGLAAAALLACLAWILPTSLRVRPR